MKKRLFPKDGGMAVVIDLPLLAIIGAEGATEMDLSTDGERLILSRVPVSSAAPKDAPRSPSHSVDFEDPKESLIIMRALQRDYGFGPEHFRRLHHFGPKASLQSHFKYCDGTGRFTSETNVIVARRMARCLELLRDGATWDRAIERATSELPFPRNER